MEIQILLSTTKACVFTMTQGHAFFSKDTIYFGNIFTGFKNF